jgi:hypothetical protein
MKDLIIKSIKESGAWIPGASTDDKGVIFSFDQLEKYTQLIINESAKAADSWDKDPNTMFTVKQTILNHFNSINK